MRAGEGTRLVTTAPRPTERRRHTMGYYIYRNRKPELDVALAELVAYSDRLKRRQPVRNVDANGLPIARRTREARIRADAAAGAAAVTHPPLEELIDDPAWHRHADDPEAWGGELGLWLATVEAHALRKAHTMDRPQPA